MSAAHWRKAMNFTQPGGSFSGGRPARAPRPAGPQAGGRPSAGLLESWRGVRARHLAVLAALLVYPWVVPPFFTYQIGAQALILGLIALSLTFLAGYGGMLSLAQMTVAGIAGYIVAILGVSGTPEISLGWPW
jgi:branched-chain amino acid transport system permease protein